MRKRREFQRREGERSARLIVIAAEGRATENIYFETLKDEYIAPNVHVEILKRNDNNSNPENVYAQIANFIKEYDIKDDDELWVVIDRDQWEIKMLSSVARKCRQNPNFHFCLSNPCFEIWLLLHLQDVNEFSEEEKGLLNKNRKVRNGKGRTLLKDRLSGLLGSYRESCYDAKKIIPHIDDAILRAEKLDVSPGDRWAQSLGTRVYLLAKSIMNK